MLSVIVRYSTSFGNLSIRRLFLKSNIERIHLLDFIRGVAIIGMIVYHAAFNYTVFYNIDISFLDTVLCEIIRIMLAMAFIIIAGISTKLSQRLILRGFTVVGAALIVSLVTFFVTPNLVIRFGILHFMGVAMLITALCKKVLVTIPRKIALPLFAALFFITKFLFPIRVDWEILFPFGLISNNFMSADYYPLIPWIFAFFFGTYLTEPLIKHQAPQWVYYFKSPIVNFLGRHSLLVYLIHQPILWGLFWLSINIIS